MSLLMACASGTNYRVKEDARTMVNGVLNPAEVNELMKKYKF